MLARIYASLNLQYVDALQMYTLKQSTTCIFIAGAYIKSQIIKYIYR